jgi:ketosteroid isomerase-like protein
MKTALCVVVLVCGVAYATVQQSERVSALQAIVATERSFARMSAERGTRESFLAYIADDGLLFRPGAVNGKKWLLEHPERVPQKRPLLSWQPAFGDVAQAGDLGYTFGPWEFKQDITDEKPVGYGHFVTVWKKQTDGSWKFQVDLGISHAAPRDPKVDWQLPANYQTKPWKATATADPASARAGLLSRDRQFVKALAAQGVVKTYDSYSAKELRLFRENSYPFEGRVESSQALSARISDGELLNGQPLGADVSLSEDLGFTNGTYSLSREQQPDKVIELGSYVRIWKRQNGNWKIVLDITNAWPPTQQSG